MFGMDREQTKQAAAVCKILGEEWRDLVAGREGFLVDRKRAGLLRQRVVWGEMDSMVCTICELLAVLEKDCRAMRGLSERHS